MNAQPLLDPKIVQLIPRVFRAAQRSIIHFGPRPPAGCDLRLYNLRPWYHDYSSIGLRTDFTDYPSVGEDVANVIRRAIGKEVLTTRGTHITQKIRDRQVLPYLEKAFALHFERFGKVMSFLDTFANDGFYAFWAARHYDVSRITCIELNIEDVRRGCLIAEILGEPRVRFFCQDVHTMDASPVDIALCMGGLYHIADPQSVIEQLRAKANVLVVHSVTSTLSDDPAYIAVPAPGWRHGCRFSHEYFLAMLHRAHWEIVECGRSVVPKADDEHSFGLSYALCVRAN